MEASNAWPTSTALLQRAAKGRAVMACFTPPMAPRKLARMPPAAFSAGPPSCSVSWAWMPFVVGRTWTYAFAIS